MLLNAFMLRKIRNNAALKAFGKFYSADTGRILNIPPDAFLSNIDK